MNVCVIGVGPFGAGVVARLAELVPIEDADALDEGSIPVVIDPLNLPDADEEGPAPIPVVLQQSDGSSPQPTNAPPSDVSGSVSPVTFEAKALSMYCDGAGVRPTGSPCDAKSVRPRLSRWLERHQDVVRPPLVALVGDGRAERGRKALADAAAALSAAFADLPVGSAYVRAVCALLPHETATRSGSTASAARELRSSTWLTDAPIPIALWMTEWDIRNVHADDAALEDEVAVLLAGFAQSTLYESLVDRFGVGATQTGVMDLAVGASMATAPNDSLRHCRAAAQDLCRRFLERNESIPPEYAARHLVRERLQLTPEVFTPELMRVPDDRSGQPDMRRELETDSVWAWDSTPERLWPDRLRSMRRVLVESKLERLSRWLYANWQGWNDAARLRLAELSYRLVEIELASLPDASFVMEKLDETVSELDLVVKQGSRAGGKRRFDGYVERLARAIEHRPFPVAMLLRYLMIAGMVFIPIRAALGYLLGGSGVSELAQAVFAGAAAALIGVAGALIHASSVNRTIHRLRTSAVDALTDWLAADLEAYADRLLEFTVQSLHGVLEETMIPALNTVRGLHEQAEAELERQSIVSWRQALDLGVFFGMEESAPHRRFDAGVESERFLREGGRADWLSLDLLGLVGRLTDFTRNRLSLVESEPVEMYLGRSRPSVAQVGGGMSDDSAAVGSAVYSAMREAAAVMMQPPDGQRLSPASFLLAPDPDSPYWADLSHCAGVLPWRGDSSLCSVVTIAALAAPDEGGSDAGS